MNRLLWTIGGSSTVLWIFITALTKGLPGRWCALIDKWTFGVISGEAAKMANGFYYDVNNQDMPTVAFLAVFTLIFILTFVLLLKVEKLRTQKGSLLIIIFFSVVIRLIVLPGEMIHENDIYRYLWDGKSSVHGVNPFKYAPADLFMYANGIEEDYYDYTNDVWIKAKNFTKADEQRLDKLLRLRDQKYSFYERIGYREVPTIYPPVAQFVFALSVFLMQDSVLFMKFIFVLFDLGAVFLIIALLKHFKRNPAMCVVYAWSPLVIKEFANSGHYDSVAVFFMMLGILGYVKRNEIGCVCGIAASALSKFFAAVCMFIIPGMLKIRNLMMFGILFAALYLPFILADHTGVPGVLQGLSAYHREWSYNSSIFELIYSGLYLLSPEKFGTYSAAKIITGMLYLIVLFKLSRKPKERDIDVVHHCFVAVAALFILSPVGDPWYFCWVMPFLCLFPYRSWVLLSGLLMLSYINFRFDFYHDEFVSLVLYTPFFVMLVIEKYLKPVYVKQMRLQ